MKKGKMDSQGFYRETQGGRSFRQMQQEKIQTCE